MRTFNEFEHYLKNEEILAQDEETIQVHGVLFIIKLMNTKRNMFIFHWPPFCLNQSVKLSEVHDDIGEIIIVPLPSSPVLIS